MGLKNILFQNITFERVFDVETGKNSLFNPLEDIADRGLPDLARGATHGARFELDFRYTPKIY